MNFFRDHPYWFKRIQYENSEQDRPNVKVSLSVELWEAICFYTIGKVPIQTDRQNEEIMSDPVLREVQMNRHMLRKLEELIQLGYFT